MWPFGLDANPHIITHRLLSRLVEEACCARRPIKLTQACSQFYQLHLEYIEVCGLCKLIFCKIPMDSLTGALHFDCVIAHPF